ncbi:MAG: MFS transporter [Coxiellaceae bacterium]|nr:MFS transporter [Coxiellaceae bacterium]
MPNHQATFRDWIALIGLSLLAFTAFLDFTIVNTALPIIQKDMHASVIQLQWMINIFTLMLSMFMIAAGRVGDIYGRKRVFFTAVIIFGIAAMGAGLSPNMYCMILFRAIQGVCAAVLFTVSVALIPQAFPDQSKQGAAISTYTAMTGAGLAIGPFAAGLIMSVTTWRWVFYVNVPIIIIGLIMCARMAPSPKPNHSIRVDGWGVLLLAITLGCLVCGLMAGEQWGWGSPTVWVLFAITLVALILLMVVERKVSSPLLDADVLTNPMLMLAALGCMLAGVVTYALLFFDPLFLHVVRHYTPFYIGLFLFAIPVMQVIMSALFAKIVKVISVPYLIAWVQAFGLLATLIHVFLNGSSSITLILVAFFSMGLVWGIANTGSVTAVNRYADPQHAGSVIGTIFTMWNIAGTIALAIATVIFNNVSHSKMDAALLKYNLTLSVSQKNTVQALLADPSNATALLKSFTGHLATEIYQAFSAAFLSGFHAVGIFASIVVFVGMLVAFKLAASAKRLIADK